jgi:hypothetical protein
LVHVGTCWYMLVHVGTCWYMLVHVGTAVTWNIDQSIQIQARMIT